VSQGRDYTFNSITRMSHCSFLAGRWSLVVRLCVVTISGILLTPSTVRGASAVSSSQIIVDGPARFEILSPGLIRLEYAGDQKFQDSTTFNMIGRNNFGRTQFSTSAKNGIRIIQTGNVTLKYLEGSGPFSSSNLQIALNNGSTPVVANPEWPNGLPTFQFGQLAEAEDTALAGGASIANNHNGYTGTGFVAGIQTVGAQLAFVIKNVTTSGQYSLQVRYANSVGGDGGNETRTMGVIVDGQAAQTMQFPITANWDTWAVATLNLQLSAGTHQFTIVYASTDTGNINIDSLAVTNPGASYPAPAAFLQYGDVTQASDGILTGGAYLAQNYLGFTGPGFVTGFNNAGAADQFQLVNVPADGSYAVQVRYDNNSGSGQPATGTLGVSVNGSVAAQLTLTPTSGPNIWSTTSVTVALKKGTNALALVGDSGSSSAIAIDTMAVTVAGAPSLLGHLPIGGYRRGLDTLDGTVGASLSPGLLYQDGWVLIDDTSGALFDPSTGTVTQRPSHGSNPYQDGYLFAYGLNYTSALSDYKTLTGPAVVLPRYTYGVWFSRYYPYSASDYENSVLPTFRSENVPLDVLVTDTDWKSPSNWDGWEFNSQYFPDPVSYYDWAHQNGLHTALNVHPSINSNDSQFAEAQSLADDGLVLSGGDYVFDWGIPDQLQAYLAIHKLAETLGNDLWWLDWCCDNSGSSLNGITPDAWIAYQYASEMSSRGDLRGFAFARAFSSLQASGYGGSAPVTTGPWADHRYTLLFTGDTYPTFGTLQFEVAFTVAVGSATGLPFVSHDIGGFHQYTEPDGTTSLADPDDLYVRWVQFATFQPILRLHSDHAYRLPWEYDDVAKGPAEQFLRLREALVPYTYTSAHQTIETGVPFVHGLYIEFPGVQSAYDYSNQEYFYGPNLLVAPATTPGVNTTTQVWIPGGTWINYFTGQQFTGPSVQSISTDLSSMPLFLKAGGIVPERANNVTNDIQNPIDQVTFVVGAGSNGDYQLYDDQGDGTEYGQGQFATTDITYRETANQRELTIANARGQYQGQSATREWSAQFVGVNSPQTVMVPGIGTLPENTTGIGWSYNGSSHTLEVRVGARSIKVSTSIIVR
jgi:Glycosyl hydrolases family 31/Domain of unknown function (DUF5110)/Carbohydrate binding module (family 35)/Carbohydrate binding module (family 6)